MAETFHFPHHAFGEAAEFQWIRVLLRTGVLLGIWVAVHLTTLRLLRRLHELEAFLRICSWCRRVGNGHEWQSMEDYFGARFQTGTSHGICPDCSQKQLAALPACTRARSGSS